ncbi:hypothetical protein [Streptomyces rubiginosohelvolus]|uniref:Secreted protein n=1 Tax=Streptomyces rubiginosohelvolus TaxID=67362 RepID=A0ABW6F635_9ACTN
MHTALVCVVGFAILVGLAAMAGFDDEPAHNPSELPAAVPDVPDDSPSTSYIPSSTPSTLVDSDVPDDPAEPGDGSNTAEERPREARESDDHYNGNYDNDDDYHRKYGRN